MRKSNFTLLSWLIIAVAALVSGGAVAEEAGKVSANVAKGKTIFTEGKGSVPACMSCHGENAMGNDMMGAPRLANIGYAYEVKQLTDFAADRRTPVGLGAVMNGFAKELTEQDRRDVAAYVDTLEAEAEFSDLKALKESGQPVGEKYLGQVLAKYGVTGKVSACASCHGYNGRGADPMFPAIGQQKYVYLVNQLKSWRDNSRTNDPIGMMRAIAKNLTDDDIYNVAAYMSSAPRTTSGNSVVPGNESTLKNITVTK